MLRSAAAPFCVAVPRRFRKASSSQLRPMPLLKRTMSETQRTAGLQARCLAVAHRLIRSCQPGHPLKMCNEIAVELDRHQFFTDGNATFLCARTTRPLAASLV